MRESIIKRDRPFPSAFFLTVSKQVPMHNVSCGNDLICKIMNMQETGRNSFQYERLGSNTRFETDACPGLYASIVDKVI